MVITTPKQNSGNVDKALIGFAVVLVAIAIGLIIAGFLAFLYLKFKHNTKEDLGSQVFKKEFYTAAIVTIIMVLGSLAGAAFFVESYYEYFDNVLSTDSDLIPHAINFLLETYVALLWAYYSSQIISNGKWKRNLVFWGGLFLIFSFFNVSYFIFSNYSSLSDYSPVNVVFDYVSTYPQNILYSWYSFKYALFNPFVYIEAVFDLFSQYKGDQFMVVKEFPTWSLFFICYAFLAFGVSSLSSNSETA